MMLGRGGTFEFSDTVSPNRLQLWVGFGTTIGRWAAPDDAVPLNAWSHVCVEYNDSSVANDPTFFINGVSVPVLEHSTPVGTSPADASSSFRIGAIETAAAEFFDGEIDEVRVYNRFLSAAEIKSLYDQSAPDKVNSSVSQSQGTGRLDSGLTAYFTLDENTGTAAADSSTNAIASLTLTNGPTWTTGQIGSGITFDGTDDYATTADTATLDFADTEDFTLTGWFNRSTFTTDDTIIAKRNGITAADTGYLCYISAADALICEVSDAVDEYSVTSASTFTAAGWNHFAFVWDQDSATGTELYINGAPNGATDTGTIGNIGTLANAVAFRLGAEADNGVPFAGSLDEARVYDRALSRKRSPTSIASLPPPASIHRLKATGPSMPRICTARRQRMTEVERGTRAPSPMARSRFQGSSDRG